MTKFTSAKFQKMPCPRNLDLDEAAQYAIMLFLSLALKVLIQIYDTTLNFPVLFLNKRPKWA